MEAISFVHEDQLGENSARIHHAKKQKSEEIDAQRFKGHYTSGLLDHSQNTDNGAL
jgi:hypothetical protein